jgi:hypothetical protein
MQRTLAGDVEITFKRVLLGGERRRIFVWDSVPIQMNPGDLNLFDFGEE